MINLSKFLFAGFLFSVLMSCQNVSNMGEHSVQNPNDTLVNMAPEDLNYPQLYDRALTLFKIPYQETDIETTFGTAHVITAGPVDAPPIVLLHGLNASSTSWYPNIKALAQNNRLYAIDYLMEINKSVQTTGVEETEEIIAWYEQIFAALKLKEFDLIGASRGGWIATNLALNDTNGIRKLVLLSPVQSLEWIAPSKDAMVNLLYTMNPKRDKLREVLQTLSVNVDSISQLYIDQYYRATTMADFDFSMAKMTPFADEQLRELKIPVLVLIGDGDVFNTSESLERAKKLIPKVETGTIKNAGHFLSVDQPEIVNKRILDFLAKK